MISFAGTIAILSRQSRSMIHPLAFILAATLALLALFLCGRHCVDRWMDGDKWWEFGEMKRDSKHSLRSDSRCIEQSLNSAAKWRGGANISQRQTDSTPLTTPSPTLETRALRLSEESQQRVLGKQREMALHTRTGGEKEKMLTVPLSIESWQSTRSMARCPHPNLLPPPNLVEPRHAKKGQKTGHGSLRSLTGELSVCADSERTRSTHFLVITPTSLPSTPSACREGREERLMDRKENGTISPRHCRSRGMSRSDCPHLNRTSG
ncbi:hypothetical protein BLNAU_12430 [Blattamonas nauphoetae]|uniref:Uncharacterized protein n=1 Tax=Blattamonas nauphoetae TaxID=2049346 RepID=A0ABQ9XPR0_9EUKA|nr:hypothetical protein BLNAU_12430 [Blattamonas nauphoetae]